MNTISKRYLEERASLVLPGELLQVRSSCSSCSVVEMFIAATSVMGHAWAGQEDHAVPATQLRPGGRQGHRLGVWQSKDVGASALATSPATTMQESPGAAGGDVGAGRRCSRLLRGLHSKASSNEAAGVSCATCSDVTDRHLAELLLNGPLKAHGD